jgi:glutathione peroxidase
MVPSYAVSLKVRLAERTHINDKETDLSQYKGKVVLIVNVASKCGNTPQYKGLEALYKKYGDKGLVIIGFPANDFGKQEPGSNEEIKQFCTSKYV